MLKCVLQSPLLKDHIQIIGIDQSLSNNNIYDHKCLGNIKNYTNKMVSVENQKQFKDILEADMVSTPGGFTKNSPVSPMTSTPIKKPYQPQEYL